MWNQTTSGTEKWVIVLVYCRFTKWKICDRRTCIAIRQEALGVLRNVHKALRCAKRRLSQEVEKKIQCPWQIFIRDTKKKERILQCKGKMGKAIKATSRRKMTIPPNNLSIYTFAVENQMCLGSIFNHRAKSGNERLMSFFLFHLILHISAVIF